ncbi:MAG TPA: AAA family ATPase [Pilimelia sp.]|nr:AAA family ATPase [Pilimelia sp.]
MTQPAAVPRPLVGRAAELGRLDQALAEAVAGRGSTVLIGGEAGVGKTRLAAELADRARGLGSTVLVGRCIDLVGTGAPYLPLLEALRPLRGSPLLAGLDGLSPLLPEPPRTHGRRPAQAGEARDAAEARDAGGQAPLFGAVWTLCERLAGEAPAVLVFEDLHWADTSTLDLVSFLAHAAHDSRLLVVATFRNDDARSGVSLRRMVTELRRARAARIVELGPLTRDEVEALLEPLVPKDLPAELLHAICARSDGNPFLAEDLAAAVVAGEQAIPHGLRDVLLQRVAHLDEAARAVLRVAAAAGGVVSYGLVAAVAPLAEGELQAALRRVVDAHVLLPDQREGTFRFRHALLAEAVYTTLLPGERGTLHGELARALAERPELAASGAVAGELAQHWAAAGRAREAVAESVRAAAQAEAMSGRAEALRHLERAIVLWPQVPDAASMVGMALPAVLAWAAELAHLTGGGHRAVVHVRRAIELSGGDPEPARVAGLYERLGSYLLPTGDRGGGLAAFRRAVELVPARPPSPERVRVLAAMGHALMLSDRYEESRACCAEAIGVADAIGEPHRATRARDVLAIDLCYLGRLDEGLPRLRAARAEPRDREVPSEMLRPTVFLSDTLLLVGQLDEAARVAEEGLALARQLGLERGVATVLAANLAEALIGTGDWTRAAAVLAEALRTLASFWSHYVHLQCAQLAVGRGESDSARRHLQASARAALAPSLAVLHASLMAELALWEGRADAAATAVADGLRVGRTDLPFGLARLCAQGVRAEGDRARMAAPRRDAAAVDESRSRAAELVAAAVRSARGCAAVTAEPGAWALVAEAEYGNLAGPPEPDRWQAATAAGDALGRPYLSAYCRWQYAVALLAAASRGGSHAAGPYAVEATGAAREAHGVATELGAWPLRREIEELAERARLDLIRPQPGQPPGAARLLGLTAREEQVLRLVARGYTNRQIAAELTISVKTASVHVSHILHKLGISSRLEAAAMAQRLRHGHP